MTQCGTCGAVRLSACAVKRTQATCELRSMARELTALLKARHTRITVTNVTDVPNPAALFYASIVNE